MALVARAADTSNRIDAPPEMATGTEELHRRRPPLSPRRSRLTTFVQDTESLARRC